MTQTPRELDLRPTLLAGGEPFSAIMQAINDLGSGQALRLLATFEPVPLYGLLAKKGFDHARQNRPVHPVPDHASARQWPEPSRHLDNRDLDPPEPMVRALAALEELQPGDVLSVLLRREPVFLFSELGKRGHEWLGEFEADGKTYRLLVRKEVGKEAAA